MNSSDTCNICLIPGHYVQKFGEISKRVEPGTCVKGSVSCLAMLPACFRLGNPTSNNGQAK